MKYAFRVILLFLLLIMSNTMTEKQIQVIMEYIEYMTPTADVIERSKIDKAIEEIADCVLVDKFDVLEILKRNIGE